MKKRAVWEMAAQEMDQPDMAGLRVRDAIDREATGATGVVLHFGEVPPGREHVLHRHPSSEEAMYVLEGSCLCLGEGDSERVRAGDAVYIGRNEWHGVRNDTDGTVRLLVVLGGVGSYAEAGYELRDPEAG